MNALRAVPSLDELATHPELAAELPAEAAEALLGRCIAAQSAIFGRLLSARSAPRPPEGEDRLLDVREAAARLGLSPDWLYRRSRRLPFVVRAGGRLRFSARGLDRWIRERRT